MLEQAQGGQAPVTEASVESRIESALFGSPAPKAKPKAPVAAQPPEEQQQAPSDEQVETPEAEEQAAPAAEETFEFELDGQKYALPKALEKAVMQQRDYTQKTMSVSEKEKNFEFLHEQARVSNLRAEFQREAAQELQQLQAYDAVLSQPVDWSSMSTDDAFRKKIQLDQWKDERAAVEKQLQAKYQQFEHKANSTIAELKAKGDELVSKRIPNWSADSWKAITEHAKKDGYTDAELSQILDPRHKVTLWKAQQFDELKAKATKTVTDVKQVKTTSANPMPQHVKDKFAFQKALAKTAANPAEQRRVVEQRIGSLFSKR